MTINEAMLKNPFNPNEGNISAYCRYLRYNVDGFYNKTNDEVKRIYFEAIKNKSKVTDDE